MHVKVHDWNSDAGNKPRCRLKLTSKMLSTAVILECISNLFPDVPPRLDEKSSSDNSIIQLKYKQCFTNAITLCEFQKNEILIESQNPTVISIAKETITNFANYRRIQFEETFTATNDTIYEFLNLIWDRLSHQQKLSRTSDLLDGLLEISMQESDLSWMSEEYREILHNQEQIRLVTYITRHFMYNTIHF